jgi:D-glycero-D-manno-heptose 1,7-bisphosphate phosphatase
MVTRRISSRSPWTVFLDRDGVINRRIDGDYVRTWADFHFLPGAIDAIVRLSVAGPRILVVTNQAGVGKGHMSLADLGEIHRAMGDSVARRGGRIDGVFACPHTPAAGCNCRKPATGLGTQAIAAHPDVDLVRSVVVGDSASDMAFAHALGARAVLVGGTDADRAADRHDSPTLDAVVPDLAAACEVIQGRWLGDAHLRTR